MTADEGSARRSSICRRWPSACGATARGIVRRPVGTIVPHTVEEAYEVADAALAGDDAKLLDELGDLLFQTVFLALLLEERGAGDLGDGRAGGSTTSSSAGTRTSSRPPAGSTRPAP